MIFSFYSYKGGVGRTVSLVHSGIHIASKIREKGYQVLLLDMDLEAPGLDVYIDQKRKGGPKGFAQLLLDYRKAGRECDWLKKNMNSYISRVRGAKNLWIMPSGLKSDVAEDEQETSRYLEAIVALRSEIPKQDSPARPKDGFFADLYHVLNDKFTYVLIDSRAGFADQAYASTLMLADALVICFRLNRANIEGIQTILGNFLLREGKCIGDREIPVIPVATPVPARGGTDIEEWMSVASRALVDPTDEKASSKDGLRTLFSAVHRIYHDPKLEIGEKLVFDFKGGLTNGFSDETPIVRCFRELADRIGVLNADRDAIASEKLELMYYNDLKDYNNALNYLIKRIRLEPLEFDHWDDLATGYAKNMHVEVATVLKTLTDEWRDDIDSEKPSKTRNKYLRLAMALLTQARLIGKDEIDAGMSIIRECLHYCSGHSILEAQSRRMYGQVIDEIVNNRKSHDLLQSDLYDESISLELAIEQYSRAIELVNKTNGDVGDLLIFRARDKNKIGNILGSLDDYEQALSEDIKKNSDHVTSILQVALYEQGLLLEFIGQYEYALSNMLAALDSEKTDIDVLKKTYMLASCLGQHEIARDIGERWAQADPQNPAMHRLKAMSLMLHGEYDLALQESHIGSLYSSRDELAILDGFIYLLWGNIGKAIPFINKATKANKTTYNRAVLTIAKSISGQTNADFKVDVEDEEWQVNAIAALSLLKLEDVRNILRYVLIEDKSVISCVAYYILMAIVDKSKRAQAKRHIDEMLKQCPDLLVRMRNHPELRLLQIVTTNILSSNVLGAGVCDWLSNLWERMTEAHRPAKMPLRARDIHVPLPTFRYKKCQSIK
ncbi:MAG: AAA family ATPase [Kiritimatiellales bacterium]|nr:AAA family ATPase [Kiritimatiellales bacterium]